MMYKDLIMEANREANAQEGQTAVRIHYDLHQRLAKRTKFGSAIAPKVLLGICEELLLSGAIRPGCHLLLDDLATRLEECGADLTTALRELAEALRELAEAHRELAVMQRELDDLFLEPLEPLDRGAAIAELPQLPTEPPPVDDSEERERPSGDDDSSGSDLEVVEEDPVGPGSNQ